MSYSSLWGVDKNFKGKELITYPNSWLVGPMVWDTLMNKYLYSNSSLVRFYMSELHTNPGIDKILNNKINNSETFEDRVLWEITNQKIFHTKNKIEIAKAFENFWKINIQKQGAHINIRFEEVTQGLREINLHEFPFFVFKNTSCDDNVEFWFKNERSLKDVKEIVTEFVFINDNKIIGFQDNLTFFKNKEKKNDR